MKRLVLSACISFLLAIGIASAGCNDPDCPVTCEEGAPCCVDVGDCPESVVTCHGTCCLWDPWTCWGHDHCVYYNSDGRKPNCADICITMGGEPRKFDGTASCTSSGWRCNYKVVDCCTDNDCPEGYECDLGTHKCEPKGGCVCNWEEKGCGVSPCANDEMKKVYVCNPPGCNPNDGQFKCDPDPSCEETSTTSLPPGKECIKDSDCCSKYDSCDCLQYGSNYRYLKCINNQCKCSTTAGACYCSPSTSSTTTTNQTSGHEKDIVTQGAIPHHRHSCLALLDLPANYYHPRAQQSVRAHLVVAVDCNNL